MGEVQVIGRDVWWDHELRTFRKKRLNLEKAPIKYRCPTCGKILVKPQDRRPITIRDKEHWRINKREIDRLFNLEKPKKEEWNDFCNRHKELFIPKFIVIGEWPIIELGFYGGVCEKCYLDGLGRHGEFGRLMGVKLREGRKKITKARSPHVWVNGELKFVTQVVYPEFVVGSEE